MLHYAVDAAEMALGRNNVYVATADEPVIRYCRSQDINVIRTSQPHINGTTRIAEAARQLDYNFIINLQADEPLIPAALLAKMVRQRRSSTAEIVSCYRLHEDDADSHAHVGSETIVKVVVSKTGQALYFSRSLIPHGATTYKTHVGLYAFTRASLQAYVELAPSPIEILESLEQLRALENGWCIDMFETEWLGQSVDTPEDLVIVKQLMRKRFAS